MSPLLLGAIVSAAAATCGLLMMSAVAAAVWRRGHLRFEHWAPLRRAHALAMLRLLPALTAIVVGAIVFLAFVRLEPPRARELPGIILSLLAGVAVAGAGRRLARGARAWRATARTAKTWAARETRTAHSLDVAAIDVPYPVVAIVGLWRPRLYIAQQVIESCDAGELDAVIAHESAHLTARDNLTRLLFLCAPAVGAATFAAIERHWVRASEEAADDRATRDRAASLALASALTKVARLAVNGRPPLLHASGILSGSMVEHRVRRLLTDPPPHTALSIGPVAATAIVMTAAVATVLSAQQAIYEAAEFCVRYLP